MDRGLLDMHKLGELLIAASSMPKNENGMLISATGALTIAARGLREMAEPLSDDYDARELRELHQELVFKLQPNVAAHTLDTMADHFDKLHRAVEIGDAETVGQFFNLYVFD